MKVRHILGISGGKDSAALAIYLKDHYPQIPFEFYNSDTKCELAETETLINRLDSYLGGITRLVAVENSPEPTPFDHFYKVYGGYLPSPQARWCTQKMKLEKMEEFVGDSPAISYVGIRGDEDREGYVSTKPNIQSIFPFRRNIWSLDVINRFFQNKNIPVLKALCEQFCPAEYLDGFMKVVRTPTSKAFYFSKKTNALLDISVKTFNRIVFEFLKTTDLPVGQLEDFPLVDNEDVIVKDDVFRILRESNVGVPAYYDPVPFEVDGQTGYYNRSRSGCYFCFFQQKIEWIWLYEQHPDLFKKAMAYEKDGYTWNQGESLADLIKPERIREIKLDALRKQEARKAQGCRLADNVDDDAFCANCFI